MNFLEATNIKLQMMISEHQGNNHQYIDFIKLLQQSFR